MLPFLPAVLFSACLSPPAAVVLAGHGFLRVRFACVYRSFTLLDSHHSAYTCASRIRPYCHRFLYMISFCFCVFRRSAVRSSPPAACGYRSLHLLYTAATPHHLPTIPRITCRSGSPPHLRFCHLLRSPATATCLFPLPACLLPHHLLPLPPAVSTPAISAVLVTSGLLLNSTACRWTTLRGCCVFCLVLPPNNATRHRAFLLDYTFSPDSSTAACGSGFACLPLLPHRLPGSGFVSHCVLPAVAVLPACWFSRLPTVLPGRGSPQPACFLRFCFCRFCRGFAFCQFSPFCCCLLLVSAVHVLRFTCSSRAVRTACEPLLLAAACVLGFLLPFCVHLPRFCTCYRRSYLRFWLPRRLLPFCNNRHRWILPPPAAACYTVSATAYNTPPAVLVLPRFCLLVRYLVRRAAAYCGYRADSHGFLPLLTFCSRFLDSLRSAFYQITVTVLRLPLISPRSFCVHLPTCFCVTFLPLPFPPFHRTAAPTFRSYPTCVFYAPAYRLLRAFHTHERMHLATVKLPHNIPSYAVLRTFVLPILPAVSALLIFTCWISFTAAVFCAGCTTGCTTCCRCSGSTVLGHYLPQIRPACRSCWIWTCLRRSPPWMLPTTPPTVTGISLPAVFCRSGFLDLPAPLPACRSRSGSTLAAPALDFHRLRSTWTYTCRFLPDSTCWTRSACWVYAACYCLPRLTPLTPPHYCCRITCGWFTLLLPAVQQLPACCRVSGYATPFVLPFTAYSPPPFLDYLRRSTVSFTTHRAAT